MRVLRRSSFGILALVTCTSALTRTASLDPVCIIGTGPGGLTVAHELESKGYSTVLFDKQSTVGGKCQSFYDGPNGSLYHPLGALIFTNETWVNTLPLIEASGLPISPGPNVTSGVVYGPGPLAGVVGPTPPVTDAQKSLLSSEFQRYTTFWTTEFAPKFTTIRYTNGVPKEFSVPMSQWLQTQQYIALPQVMEIGMVPFGYGDISQTPAVYMLQYFTPDVLGAFLGIVPSHNVDFHQVMVHYAASVQGKIHLNSPVTAIDRSKGTPTVTYTQGTASFKQRCSKIVLAFPPTPDNLSAIKMLLSPQEMRVFSKVQITAYWASAVETKLDFPKPYFQTPFEPLGAPVSFIRIFNQSSIATAWSWGVTEDNFSSELVMDLLISTISQVQAGLGIPSPNINRDAVKAIRQWDYFPHFGSTDLRGGVYAEYNALQGQQNTYFSSGLNGFELVEFAIRAGKDLVEMFF